jgi:7,8-dihydropterin-6-yl-methyl-4-(beta-D-ribofuranosyl)aminobenzene 5'-phosphate synthase
MKAKEVTKGEIYLVTGGFHLAGYEESFIRGIIRGFREAGVKKVAPSHCTGEPAFRLFQEEYGEDYMETGVGSVIEI